MGNCMETCNQRKQEMEMHDHDQRKQEDHDHNQRDETEINGGPFVKESSLGEKGKLRVKIVVTKEELEWLMVQLNNKGGKSLEDVLEEIERGRAKVEVSWKPSLESIMECPEVVEMDR